jgi:hypothetical protein
MHRSTVALAACLFAIWGAGCADADSAAESEPAVDASDVWTATSSAGTVVRVSPDTLPLRAGNHRFEVVLEPAPAPQEEVSIDLIAPSMLSHGVLRFPGRRLEEGRFEVRTEIPMEGEWLLYVNVGDGVEAAEFALVVTPAESGPMHGPGATHSAVHP